MKTRRGFVSNSSSSSFVIALPKVPENADELQKLLFGNEKWYSNLYYKSSRYDTKTVAQTVFNDLNSQATHFQMLEVGLGGCDASINYDDYEDVNGVVDWDRYQMELRKAGLEKLECLIEANEGCVFYVLEYSDSTSYGSALEQGDLFKAIPHIKINNH